MKLRRLVPMLSAAAGIPWTAAATGFVDSVPDVRVQPIPETMRTTEDDYPPKSRRFGQEGVVQLAITVSAEGRVTACSIVRSSGARDLDERSCMLAMERFRFRPARRDGMPVEDKAILPVDWRLLEASQPVPPR